MALIMVVQEMEGKPLKGVGSQGGVRQREILEPIRVFLECRDERLVDLLNSLEEWGKDSGYGPRGGEKPRSGFDIEQSEQLVEVKIAGPGGGNEVHEVTVSAVITVPTKWGSGWAKDLRKTIIEHLSNPQKGFSFCAEVLDDQGLKNYVAKNDGYAEGPSMEWDPGKPL